MLKDIADFFRSIPKSSWQDIVLTSVVIPIVIYLYTKAKNWITTIRPVNLLLKGYRSSKEDVLIFLSQLSGAVNVGPNAVQLNPDPKYIATYPNAIGANQNATATRIYQHVDPVWSESDGRCAADVFNILGQAGVTKRFRIAETIGDWSRQASPIFGIGFCPKSVSLLKDCEPIYFQGSHDGSDLKLKGSDVVLGCVHPNDAGIIQKTFLKNTKTPVFILAGHGTTGTEVAGNLLNQFCVALGKLYGDQTFCVMFAADITKGREYHDIKAVYPRPPLWRAFFYPLTFIKWYRKKVFPKKSRL